MVDNLPPQEGTDDIKLQELEKELKDLEQKAQGELNQQTEAQIPQTQQPTIAPQPQTNDSLPKNPPVSNQPTATTGSSGGGGMRKVMWIGLVLLLLSLVGVLGYYLGTSNARPRTSPTPVPTQTPEPTELPTAGWQTYENEDGWSVKHPEGLEARVNAAVSFMMFGPTQKEGTEFYDGISLTFRSGALGGLTLMEFVNDKAQEIEDDPISEVSAGPMAFKIAGLSGYGLTTQGLGTFEYYYLPMGERNYLEIIDATQDPTGQGFAETVKLMLETIRVSEVLPSPTVSPTASPTAAP